MFPIQRQYLNSEMVRTDHSIVRLETNSGRLVLIECGRNQNCASRSLGSTVRLSFLCRIAAETLYVVSSSDIGLQLPPMSSRTSDPPETPKAVN